MALYFLAAILVGLLVATIDAAWVFAAFVLVGACDGCGPLDAWDTAQAVIAVVGVVTTWPIVLALAVRRPKTAAWVALLSLGFLVLWVGLLFIGGGNEPAAG